MSSTSFLPTRERLLREGLRLFAAQGFAATTVGEIEAAAGLQPRRGALYRHFASKDALLETAVTRAAEAVRQAEFDIGQLPIGDPVMMGRLAGQWIMADLDANRLITHILERDGDRLPALRDRFRASSEMAFRTAAAILRRWADATGRTLDAEAVAVILVGALVNARRSSWTLGAPPLTLQDDRIVEAFAAVFASLVGVP